MTRNQEKKEPVGRHLEMTKIMELEDENAHSCSRGVMERCTARKCRSCF